MKINYIKYKNYRCFNNLKVDFKTTQEKNISMVVAPNGGGKTEMLFSVTWVLYGFDFKKLKGKGYTPYALNSTLYQDLMSAKPGKQYECSVTFCFEQAPYMYVVTRTENFVKSNSGISKTESMSLEQKDMNTGITLPKMNDMHEISAILTRVIPESILGGIIFDGERMKQLSQVDDDARKAVEGVIKKITNEELFQLYVNQLKALQKTNSKLIHEYTKKHGFTDLAAVEERIKTLSLTLETNRSKVEKINNALASYDERLDEIHIELSGIEDSRKYEEKRNTLKALLKEAQKNLDSDIDRLYKDLYHGSELAMTTIIDDVTTYLDNVDIPSGLNVSAVKSILLRPRCICGHPMTHEMEAVLNELIKNLPPDNINSTLMEMSRQMGVHAKTVKETLSSTYNSLFEREKDIARLTNDIAHISTLITEGASVQAQKLEKENQDINRKYGDANSRKIQLENDIEGLENEIVSLKKRRELASNGQVELEFFNKRDAFIVKCLSAIDAINKTNIRESVRILNSRLSNIYQEISEDTGRNLYITQFGDIKKKFRLISYLKNDFNNRKAKLYNAGKIHQFDINGLKEDEIDEIIINEIAQSSSTGQSKINSLAFAKAILEYSSLERDSSSTEISREYPFLIDSPFTELSNQNLTKAAEKIHTFAKQIILLISEESLSGVSSYLEPYVNSITKLEKSKDETVSHLI